MLTLKLYRGHVTKIVEATELNIFPCGRADGSDDDPTKRTNKVREIAITPYGGDPQVFFIADNEEALKNAYCGDLAPFWNGAYIENAHGATTETVRPY